MKGERLGVGPQAHDRRGGRGRRDRGRPAARPRLHERQGERRRLFRPERRLQVGGGGAEPLGAEGVAAIGEGAEGGIDPPRRPERLTGPVVALRLKVRQPIQCFRWPCFALKWVFLTLRARQKLKFAKDH
jgi:hypothetical protein